MDLRNCAFFSWAANKPWSCPSELDERDIFGAGGGGGGGGPETAGEGAAFHGGGGQGGAGGTGGGGEVRGSARDMGGGWGAGGADEVRWWPWPVGVGGTGGPWGELALGLLITEMKIHLNINDYIKTVEI